MLQTKMELFFILLPCDTFPPSLKDNDNQDFGIFVRVLHTQVMASDHTKQLNKVRVCGGEGTGNLND